MKNNTFFLPIGNRLDHSFFSRDVLMVAPELVGKILVRVWADGTESRYIITETEAYRGTEDLACHASKGKTPRTEVMYKTGGHIYIYLIYGMYWMLNVVTGMENEPQAVLIRGISGHEGPGKLTRALQLDKSFNKEDILSSKRLWMETFHLNPKLASSTRIGIDYAGPEWSSKPWRWTIMDYEKITAEYSKLQ